MSFVEQVNHELGERVTTYFKDAQAGFREDLCDYLARGSKLRPRLLYHIAYGLGASEKEQSKAVLANATALEAFHRATLIQDDIADNDDTREGLPAIHAKHGLLKAIYATNIIREQFVGLVVDSRLHQLLIDAYKKVQIGQFKEEELRQSFEPTLEDYHEVVKLKSAGFAWHAVYAGAHIANKPIDVDSARKWCLDLALLFQTVDDLEDSIGYSADRERGIRNAVWFALDPEIRTQYHDMSVPVTKELLAPAFSDANQLKSEVDQGLAGLALRRAHQDALQLRINERYHQRLQSYLDLK